MDKNPKDAAIREAKPVQEKAVDTERVVTNAAKKASYVYLLTKPVTEGEWKPQVEIVKADDPRAVAGPYAMVLPHPEV